MDARIVKSRSIAFDAAAHILRTLGLPALTHQNVAQQSGLSRATIYRHWPTIPDLIVDLLGVFSMPHFVSVNGNLHEFLRENLTIQIGPLMDPDFLRVHQALNLFALDSSIEPIMTTIYAARVESARKTLSQYVQVSHYEASEVLALLIGPSRQMITFSNAAPSDLVIEATVASCLDYIEAVRS